LDAIFGMNALLTRAEQQVGRPPQGVRVHDRSVCRRLGVGLEELAEVGADLVDHPLHLGLHALIRPPWGEVPAVAAAVSRLLAAGAVGLPPQIEPGQSMTAIPAIATDVFAHDQPRLQNLYFLKR